MRISIVDLECTALVGCYDHEQVFAQPLRLHLTVDGLAEPRDDLPETTIDYADLRQRVIRCVTSGRWRLLESLAQDVADGLMGALPVGAHLTLRLEKPHALADGRPVIELERTRSAEDRNDSPPAPPGEG